MKLVKIFEGESPIILTQPHGGTYIPKIFSKNFNEIGLSLLDTDWHINRLYFGLLKEATVVQALFSRYIIDVNRDPSGRSLYPNENSTELCPTKNFLGQAIYKNGMEPINDEVMERIVNYHSVYHKEILAQLQRIKSKYGFVLLFDCHSIKSSLPFLFKGEIPDLNFGTNDGNSCDSKIEKDLLFFFSKNREYKYIFNGRFKGGWTTRHYGDPKESIHAIQLEISQKTYMEEFSPWIYKIGKAKELRKYLRKILIFLENTLLKN